MTWAQCGLENRAGRHSSRVHFVLGFDEEWIKEVPRVYVKCDVQQIRTRCDAVQRKIIIWGTGGLTCVKRMSPGCVI